MPFVAWLDIVWWTLVDMWSTGWVQRSKIITALLEMMDEAPVPDPDTFGTTEAEIRHAEAAYEMFPMAELPDAWETPAAE